MSGYKNTLNDGREIYIPTWPIDVALENLTRAGQQLGAENVINIAGLNMPAFIVAIMGAKDPKNAVSLVTHFVCQARVAGNKIEPGTIQAMFEDDLAGVAELFTHVMHSQYSRFFELGLAKAVSPSKSDQVSNK